jgi:uncharacterized membrane protein YfcA
MTLMLMLNDVLALLSGSIVGLVLGLVGGGGSILAVPLLVYVVGIKSPHVAIGTSAVAVALSALSSLVGHARTGNVRWPCAVVFALAGIAGAAVGSTVGKLVDGQRLLALFGILMIVIALLSFRRKSDSSNLFAPLTPSNMWPLGVRLMATGLGAGFASGFFGIGGGFLVVPGLIASAHLPMLEAIGSSLVSVTGFGATTAINYALSGLVDWRIASFFVIGGTAGGVLGGRLAMRLSRHKAVLGQIFAVVVASVGLYVAVRGFASLI